MAPTPLEKTLPAIAGVADVAEIDMNVVDGVTIADLSPRTIITVRNADAVNPHPVTFVTSFQVGGLGLDDKVETIPADSTRRFAGFDPKYYGRTMLITGDSTEVKLQAMQVS